MADIHSATNESLQISSGTYTDPDSGELAENDFYIRSFPSDGGSHTVIEKFTATGPWAYSGISVAWGDDTKGGVVREDGHTDSSYASQEFYNENGSLIKQSWGWATYDTYGISWVESYGENIAGLAGITTAPQTVYTIDRWDGGTHTKHISTNNTFEGGTDPVISADRWDVYFKADTAIDGAWAAGDAIYNWQSNTSSNDGGVWQNVTAYTKGYEVPVQTTALTGDFYFEDRYPLKYLLPLTGAYEGMQIVQEEGETWTDTWTDTETGEEFSWSWTDYSFFIDADGDRLLDNGAESEDLQLTSIWMDEHWLWDPATYESHRIKAPFFTTTGGRLPSYFSSPDGDLVDTVKARIDLIYAAELATLNPSDFKTDLMDPAAVPQFDQLQY